MKYDCKFSEALISLYEKSGFGTAIRKVLSEPIDEKNIQIIYSLVVSKPEDSIITLSIDEAMLMNIGKLAELKIEARKKQNIIDQKAKLFKMFINLGYMLYMPSEIRNKF